MRKLHILMPALLTVSMPIISLSSCGCNKPISHKLKIDPASDLARINVTTPIIVLNQDLIINYEMKNPLYRIDMGQCTIKFNNGDYEQLQPHVATWNTNKITIKADSITTYDITICLKTKWVAYINKELTFSGTDYYRTDPFNLEENQYYCIYVYNYTPQTFKMTIQNSSLINGYDIDVVGVLVNDSSKKINVDYHYTKLDPWLLEFNKPLENIDDIRIYLACHVNIESVYVKASAQ